MNRLVFLLFSFILGYLAAVLTYPRPFDTRLKDTTSESSPVVKTNPDYVVDIPAKYFDAEGVYNTTDDPIPGDTYILKGGIEVKHPPVEITPPLDIQVVNEEFSPKEVSRLEVDIGD